MVDEIKIRIAYQISEVEGGVSHSPAPAPALPSALVRLQPPVPPGPSTLTIKRTAEKQIILSLLRWFMYVCVWCVPCPPDPHSPAVTCNGTTIEVLGGVV